MPSASRTGISPARTWRIAASNEPSSTHEPVWTTTPSAPSSTARTRLCATVCTDRSKVSGVGLPRLTRYGAWTTTRIPAVVAGLPERLVLGGLALAQRPAAGVAGEDLQRLGADRPSAFGQHLLDEPLADLDVGADRVAQGRGEGVERGGHGRLVGGQTTKTTTVLPFGTDVPLSGSCRTTRSTLM